MVQIPQILQILSQQKQQRDAEKRAQEERSRQQNVNPLGVLAGGAAGFLTGGPVGGALGALGGLGSTEAQGMPGVARAGLQGYQMGNQMKQQGIQADLQSQFADAIAAGDMEKAKSIAVQTPTGLEAATKSLFPQQFFFPNLPGVQMQPRSINPTGTDQELPEGTVIQNADGTQSIVKGNQLVPLKGAK